MSVIPRLNRLFGPDGRCFDVAIDHGFFNELAFLDGIENMPAVIAAVARAAPDAVQLSPGNARHLQSLPGPRKPALVLRTDAANVYGRQLPRQLFSELLDAPVELALRLDAACVVVNLLLLPDQPELHRQCVRNVMALKPACERYGLPLMVEPLVMQANATAGRPAKPGGREARSASRTDGRRPSAGYMVDGDVKKIAPLVRQAVELGADVIKADPTSDLGEYGRVIEVAGGVPVLVRGGGRVSDAEILERTWAVMQTGARGIVYGRNVIQHAAPERMTRALMAVVHEGATPAQAQAVLAGA